MAKGKRTRKTYLKIADHKLKLQISSTVYELKQLRWVPLVEQELLIGTHEFYIPIFFSGVRVAQTVEFCVVFCGHFCVYLSFVLIVVIIK
jgi:hypothetical protein